ncbi:MAG: hypothetical protein P8Y93_09450 [Acidobacteriota bacterium]
MMVRSPDDVKLWRTRIESLPGDKQVEKEDIQKLYGWLQERVTLDREAPATAIAFDEPGERDFREAGFPEEAIQLTLGSDWWPEMVTDIVETPEFAEPDEPPEQVLTYARDVVKEYVWKRLL